MSSSGKNLLFFIFGGSAALFLLIMLTGVDWTQVNYDVNRGSEAFSLSGTTSFSTAKAAEQTSTFTKYSITDSIQLTNCASTASVVAALTSLAFIFHLIVIGSWVYTKSELNQRQLLLSVGLIILSWILTVASLVVFNQSNECLNRAKNAPQALGSELLAGSGLGIAAIFFDTALLGVFAKFSR
jgi:TRAP-type C4-dicarboxylate transport system permease small subunit